MNKISYITLQKKYPGKVVILNKSETKILAVGRTGREIKDQIKEKGLEKVEFVIQGPISNPAIINVYFSLRR